MKKLIITMGVLCCTSFLFFGCKDTSYFQEKEAALANEDASGEEELSSDVSDEGKEGGETSQEIYVQVCGAVKSPGVFSFSPTDRVFQAIEAAGGLREDADQTLLNQAEVLQDGQKIYVYTMEEAKEMASATSSEAEEEDDGRINLNTASKEELMTLSGIGESKATAIIAYREEHGGFSSVEELKNISGIKDGVYSKVADYLCVN